MDQLIQARFNVKVDRTGGPENCHPWMGAQNPGGYGLFIVKGRQMKAHRVAWEIENGPIPEGLVIRHDCDNPPCVNIRHLRLGTVAQNNQDSKDRNRHRAGARNSVAKLTEGDVLRARQLRLDGMTYKGIANVLGVSYTAAHYVVNGTTWSDLPKPANLPRHVPREHIADEIVEMARRMRDDEGLPWRRIVAATGYTREHLLHYLPRRTGYNPHPPALTPDEADEAVRLRRSGLSWTKLERHFKGKIGRMTLYQAWSKDFRWWREAEERLESET